MSHIINAAIVGFGKSGRNIHAPLIEIEENIRLAAVASRSTPEHIEGMPNVQVFRSLNELLKDETIDLVIITLPNHMHFSAAKKALQSGKHVVVDKPFAVTTKETDLLINLADENGCILSVFQNRRWDGDFLTIKKLIENNAVGDLKEFHSSYNRYRKELKDDAWKEKNLPGSGILYDLSPHLIDQSIQLFGIPISLYADVRYQRGGESDDWFEIDFYYDGFKVKLMAGMLVLDNTPRFILRGDEGSFVKYGFDPQEERLADGRFRTMNYWSKEESETFGELKTVQSGKIKTDKIETTSGDYTAFYKNVAEAIQHQSELVVKPQQAREVIRLIELCIESAEQGRKIYTGKDLENM